MQYHSRSASARGALSALMVCALTASLVPGVAFADAQSGSAGGTGDVTASVQAESPALDPANLQDGTYTVNFSMLNAANPGQASMSDGAIEKPLTLNVSNGSYTATVQMQGLTIGSFKGYLQHLWYLSGGSYAEATVNSSYTDIVDSFNDDGKGGAKFYYPKSLSFPLLNKDKGDTSAGYVDMQVFVPVMESINTGSGTQRVYMSIDWSTIQKTGGTTPVTPVTPVDPVDEGQVQREAALSELNAAVSDAQGISNSDGTYTAASFKVLTDAIAAAQAAAADSASTKDQLDAAAKAIADARGALVRQADADRAASLEALNAAIEEARGVSNADGTYTAASFKALADAIGSAEKLASDSASTKDQLDAAAVVIAEARKGLVEQAVVDRAAALESLNAAIAEAKAVSNADGAYTAESFKALEDAVAAAEKVAAEGTSTKDQLDAAAKSVATAQSGLVAIASLERQASLDALNAAISDAGAVSNSDGTYTEASFGAFADVVAAAQKVAANQYATKGQLESAAQSISRAKAGLVTTRSVSLGALNGVLDSAKAIGNEGGVYTEESYRALADAIAAAETLAADSSSTAAQLDAAAKAITEAQGALAQVTTTTVSGITYEVSGTGATVTGVSKGLAKATVAASVKIAGTSYKVTAITAGAFENCKKLTKATIGKNVTAIGARAFRGCGKLKSVTIKGRSVKSIGKQAFRGIAKKATFKCPAAKKAAYKKLVKKAGAPKGFKVK